MPDQKFAFLPGSQIGTLQDMGDGTFAIVNVQRMSTTDRNSLSGVYRRAAAVNAIAGDGLFISGVTTAGAITVTLANGGSLNVNVPIGSTLLPLSATAVNLGTTGGTAQSLFFT